jgi:hypothetical protein
MTMIVPATLLRHRPPALTLGPIVTRADRRLVCRGVDAGRWPWPRLLEGAAQVAGLLAGLQPDGPGPGAVIAEFRDIVVPVTGHRGAVRLDARLERRLAQFWRCRCEARSPRGALLLAARVTVASGGGGAA